MKTKIFTCIMAVCLCSVFGKAPDFAPVFRDHMVLQQGRELIFTGSAAPGEKLQLAFAGHTISGNAGKDGRWSIKMPPLAMSRTPRTMTLKGLNGTRKLNGILVGEVWLCSGQSNMHWPLNKSLNGKEAAASVRTSEIRVFWIDGNCANTPQEKTSAKWRVLTPALAEKISAVAFHFGRRLHKELNIPIGLICAHRGGTMIEPWTPAGAYDAYPDLKKKVEKLFNGGPDKKSKTLSKKPENQPHVIYNAAIHPLKPYVFRGVIWYQGCSNVWTDSTSEYLLKQQALFDGWKKSFSNPDMKFYLVQIAPLKRRGASAQKHVGIWLAQQKFADANPKSVKIAIINDVGDLNNIHPVNKEPVGIRLANLALKYDYGCKIKADFPRVKTCIRKQNLLILDFDHVTEWKTTDNAAIQNFEISDGSGKFVQANVTAKGSQLIVSTPGILKPESVRYMFDCSHLGNLVNEAGLPVGTFETKAKEF